MGYCIYVLRVFAMALCFALTASYAFAAPPAEGEKAAKSAKHDTKTQANDKSTKKSGPKKIDPAKKPAQSPAKKAGKAPAKSAAKNSGKPAKKTPAKLPTAGTTPKLARDIALDYRLTGNKALPETSQKKLKRGAKLPEGLTLDPPSRPMVLRLPLHQGYEWRVAGCDLILVQEKTEIVADVLKNVFK